MEILAFAALVAVIIAALAALGVTAIEVGVDSRSTEPPTGFSPWR